MPELTPVDFEMKADTAHWSPTRRSVEDARAAQMRERAAFTRSTGARLTDDGLIRHRAVPPLEHD